MFKSAPLNWYALALYSRVVAWEVDDIRMNLLSNELPSSFAELLNRFWLFTHKHLKFTIFADNHVGIDFNRERAFIIEGYPSNYQILRCNELIGELIRLIRQEEKKQEQFSITVDEKVESQANVNQGTPKAVRQARKAEKQRLIKAAKTMLNEQMKAFQANPSASNYEWLEKAMLEYQRLNKS